MAAKRFVDLVATEEFSDVTIVLDVDGTLVADGHTDMTDEVHAALGTLASRASVHLCSNAEGTERLAAFAEGTQAQIVRSSYRKPDARVIADVPRTDSLVVIGDKYLTDGLLAVFAKGRFVRVRRYRDAQERLSVSVAYALDGLLGPALCFFARLIP